MKKLRVISFAIFYAAFNVGVFVNFHFCYETLHYLTVLVQPENCCHGGCCHNATFEMSVNDDYDDSNFQSLNPIPAAFIIHQSLGVNLLQLFPVDPIIQAIDTGPVIGQPKNPLYLSNRVLLI